MGDPPAGRTDARALRPAVVLAALGALLPARAAAQYLNRATWLGREVEGLRRDFDQGPEYYLDRTAYCDLPAWVVGRDLDPFGDRLVATGGSVSTSRLTVETVANFGVPLDADDTVARLHYLQSEHQTAQYQRTALGLERRLSEAAAAFFQLEGTPDKSRSDLSLGMQLGRGADGGHRLTVTAVDFASRKSDDFDHPQQPVALLLSGFADDPEGFGLAYELGVQLPMTERWLDTGETFELDRTIGALLLRWRLGPADSLLLRGEGELTHKELSDAASGGLLERGYAELQRLRFEWWREAGCGRHLALGGTWLHLRTDAVRPADPGADLAERRTEAMLSGTARVPLDDHWALEPYVLAGLVRYDRRGAAGQRFDGFQGRLGMPVCYVFSQRASLRVDVALQLDEAAFAGGGVQFAATF